jgi:hypothetical protein
VASRDSTSAWALGADASVWRTLVDSVIVTGNFAPRSADMRLAADHRGRAGSPAACRSGCSTSVAVRTSRTAAGRGVTVLAPADNEEQVIATSVRAALDAGHPEFEPHLDDPPGAGAANTTSCWGGRRCWCCAAQFTLRGGRGPLSASISASRAGEGCR